MPREKSHHANDPVGERLRREALECRSAFSETLHDRIATVIADRRAETVGGAIRPATINKRPLRRLASWAAVAGALLVAIGVSWWLLGHSSPVDLQRTDAGQLLLVDHLGPSLTVMENDDAVDDRPAGPNELMLIRQLTEEVVDQFDLWDKLAMLEPSPKRLFLDDARRMADMLLSQLPPEWVDAATEQ